MIGLTVDCIDNTFRRQVQPTSNFLNKWLLNIKSQLNESKHHQQSTSIKFMESLTCNIICMKWGTKYGPEYVNRLFTMVSTHLSLEFDFYCITDDPKGIHKHIKTIDLPKLHFPPNTRGPWAKVLMFKKDLFGITGKTMFLDLDVVIVGNLDKFFQFSSNFSVRHEFEKSKEKLPYGNTSVYVFEAGSLPEIFDNYMNDQEKYHRLYGTAEQEYVTRSIYKIGKLDFLPNNWIVSFKEHCLPRIPFRYWQTPTVPKDASIVAFHGRPFPDDAAKGEWPLDGKAKWKRLYKYTRPCPWIRDAWNSSL